MPTYKIFMSTQNDDNMNVPYWCNLGPASTVGSHALTTWSMCDGCNVVIGDGYLMEYNFSYLII